MGDLTLNINKLQLYPELCRPFSRYWKQRHQLEAWVDKIHLCHSYKSGMFSSTWRCTTFNSIFFYLIDQWKRCIDLFSHNSWTKNKGFQFELKYLKWIIQRIVLRQGVSNINLNNGCFCLWCLLPSTSFLYYVCMKPQTCVVVCFGAESSFSLR